jgi:hypothetical protein
MKKILQALVHPRITDSISGPAAEAGKQARPALICSTSKSPRCFASLSSPPIENIPLSPPGYAEEAFDKSLPENQQFAFLRKPFTLSQLVAAVKETMAPG